MALKDVVANRKRLLNIVYVWVPLLWLMFLYFHSTGVLDDILGKIYKEGVWKVCYLGVCVRERGREYIA